jgi:kynurenine formamidase
MTYAYDENTIYWPNATPFKLTSEFHGMTGKGYWYAANFYAASEHGGTQFYPDPKNVLGTDKKGLPALPELSFPAFSRESAEFLTKQRNIKGIALTHQALIMASQLNFYPAPCVPAP